MKNKILLSLGIFILINNFSFFELKSQIINVIVVKVGNSLITSIDIENEIITNLLINKQEITQENINNNKKYSIKNLIKKLIKKNEINKYEIKKYSKDDLQNYINSVAKKFNTNTIGLKEIFIKSGVSYDSFVEKYETELLWNTLIFHIYKNQININMIDVENEIEKIKINKNEIEIEKIKEDILLKKKQEKLNLFSRSHYSNLENTIPINFQ